MKICVVTGSRAEYGLLRPMMRLISEDHKLDLQILVTGQHLDPTFGETWKEIEQDGFEISAKVEMLLSSDTGIATAKSTGIGLIGIADALGRLSPDWVVVLGDRFETFAAAAACTFLGIPIGHFHGGERTEGAFDESLRHSITKMSHLHFTANEDYRRRVVQLGEHPDRVSVTGAPGLDTIAEIEPLSKSAFEKSIGCNLAAQNALVTYHPETLGGQCPSEQFANLLDTLDQLPDLGLIFTYPNSDKGGRAIIAKLTEFAGGRPSACVHPSLGQERYFSALRHVDLVVGNSSSGLIEVPAFGIPTVNIGDRQRGRLRGSSVIDCKGEQASIRSAIEKALSPEFRESAKLADNPYGRSGASKEALDILLATPKENILRKEFHDLGNK